MPIISFIYFLRYKRFPPIRALSYLNPYTDLNYCTQLVTRHIQTTTI
jgi:hypothetical protein